MRARVMVGPAGQPGAQVRTAGLQFSCEPGGGGNMTFATHTDDAAAVGLQQPDRVLILELETAAGVWTPVFPFATRGPWRRAKVGDPMVDVDCVGLLQQWASDTVIYPEYCRDVMVRGAGDERGLGWMATLYDWQSDPREDWDQCKASPRGTGQKPPGWPAGSSAVWITAKKNAGDPDYDASERKLFRSRITIPGTPGVDPPQVVAFFLSSDESADLWVAGERVIQTSYTEEGRKYTERADMVLVPGTYSVGIDTATHVTKGGDGTDPVLFAAHLTDEDNEPTTELLASNATGWGATRRDDQGPGSEPPGPTPGSLVIEMITTEAATRGAAGWQHISLGFDAFNDSYGRPWGVSSERMVRYGLDDYWAGLLQPLGETECDTWLDPDLTLQAAPEQGVVRAVTLTDDHIAHMSDVTADYFGSVGVAKSHAGWAQSRTPGWRREFGLEVGQAISLTVARRVLAAALAEQDRWDATVDYVPGPVPMVDFGPGDRVSVTYAGVSRQARVVGISGRAGEGGVLWQLELSNEAQQPVMALRGELVGT